jgi:hypothetical protein
VSSTATAPPASAEGDIAASAPPAATTPAAPPAVAPPEADAEIAVAAASAPASAAVAVADPPAGTLDLSTVTEVWPAVLDTIRERHALLGTVLREARPVEVADRQVTLAFEPSQTFLRRKAEDATCRELVQEAFRSLLGVAPRLEFELRERDEGAEAGVAPALTEEEWVARFKQEFDAEEIVPDDGEDQT